MPNAQLEDFQTWSDTLETVWNLRTKADCDAFLSLMDMVTGKEDLRFAEKLVDAVRIACDDGLYERLYNTLWSFPEDRIGRLLAKRLPDFQRRMGKSDQVCRFYLPIEHEGGAQRSFLDEAGTWNETDRRTAVNALKKWSMESDGWEKILVALGVPTPKKPEDPIPLEWPDIWKKRLEKGRKQKDGYGISGILWKGGKKEWRADLDFLLELLALDHGGNWRQVDIMVTPLWTFAHKAVYSEFISRLASLPADKRTKILNNVKRCNASRYKLLADDSDGSE